MDVRGKTSNEKRLIDANAFPKVFGECMGESNMTSWISVNDRLPED